MTKQAWDSAVLNSDSPLVKALRVVLDMPTATAEDIVERVKDLQSRSSAPTPEGGNG